MRPRLSLWLLLSLGVHAVLVGLVLLLIGLSPRPLPMLLVDLVEGFLGASGSAAAGGTVPVGPGRREARAPGSRLTATSPRSERAADGTAVAGRAAPGPIASPGRPAPEERARSIEMPPRSAPPTELAPVEPSRTAPQRAPVDASRTVTEAGVSARPPAQTPVAPTVGVTPPPGSRGGGTESAPRAPDPGGAAPGASAGDGAGGAGIPGAGGAAAGSGASAGDGPGLGLRARDGSVLALAIPGNGTGIGSEYQGYARLLGQRVQETLVYPPAALRRKLTGSVDLRVTVDATGAITDVTLTTSSTHRLLDEAAVQAAREVGRVPFPRDLAPRLLRIPVPVRFDHRVDHR